MIVSHHNCGSLGSFCLHTSSMTTASISADLNYLQLKASQFLRPKRPTRRVRFLVRIVRTMDRPKVACDRASRGCNRCKKEKKIYYPRIEQYLIKDHRKRKFSSAKLIRRLWQ